MRKGFSIGFSNSRTEKPRNDKLIISQHGTSTNNQPAVSTNNGKRTDDTPSSQFEYNVGEEQKISPLRNAKSCTKIGVGEDQQQYVRLASEISGGDIKFLALLEAENALWKIDRKSTKIAKNGVRDIGFCQINPNYHPKITNNKRFLTDAKWQLEQCWKLYKGGTKFYGKKNVHKTIKNFNCK